MMLRRKCFTSFCSSKLFNLPSNFRSSSSSSSSNPHLSALHLSPSPPKAATDLVSLTRHYGTCYWELSKARLSMLVVATSGTGFVLGSTSAVDLSGLSWTCLGTMMVSASASSLNQVFETNNDAKMKRTCQRPLPSGRISIPHAVAWASSVGLGGTALLATQTNMLAAGLAASNLVLYAFVYTPLKQIHPVNTWVGAIVGAIPPLLGWAAASGDISLNGWILPAALYFWQLPHFMALAYMCRDDYAAGGFKMYSLADASGRRTALVALRNSIYLIPLGFLAYDWGMTTGWFCLESTVLTLAISAAAFSFYRDRTKEKARRMFHASLLYLPVFMSGLLVHRRSDNQQFLEENAKGFVKFSSSLETSELDDENGDKKIKSRRPFQARSPVAYASIAPFPFLPAPSYDYSI
ncbi:protoheme IX farnesyltransferase, mitochondrial [Lotus japonicus]|uniref:protoheme IX farnesyltransferase, mitochondrial n=1 Tax=Lotus japonicus TaxID=34305 RepID=UPI00258740FA|nr:protoheme IX farnesyltransferase, mitochondrial [Lotus japonicus]